MDWLHGVRRLREMRQAGVLVTVTAVRGHAPREAGAKMVVVRRPAWGSVGGGNLEAVAVDRARALIETMANAVVSPRPSPATCPTRRPSSTACSAAAAEVTVLLEPLAVRPAVAIFGVGHVGLELARILARHDLDLHLVDSRAEQLDPSRAGPARPTRWRGCTSTTCRCCPSWCWRELPAGTHVLVMTHDHAEDLALFDAALRAAHLGSIGLIGSSAKWARFRRTLLATGRAGRRRPDHHPDRPARTAGQGPGGDRGRRRGRAAGLLREHAARGRDRRGRDGGGRRQRADSMTLFRGTFLDTPTTPSPAAACASSRTARCWCATA